VTQTDKTADGTRERLVAGAMTLFAERGFESVSTRELARAADANLSAITYHFGGKEGLYCAVVERLVADLEPNRRAIRALLVDGVTKAGNDRAALASLVAQFVNALVNVLLGGLLPEQRMRLLLREITHPGAAFEIIMKGHIDPLHDAVGGLVAAAIGRPAKDERTLLLVQAVIGQCLGFGLAKAVVFWRLGWQGYGRDEIDKVAATLTASTLAILALPAAGNGAAS
jgi:AcrR family transcriptional regulator